MLSTFVNAVFVVALATRHVAAELSITTPTLTQCQEAVISCSGGQPNYALFVLPSGDPCADSLADIPEQEGSLFTWKVTLPANAKVELLVEDANSNEAWSGVITVQNSSDASCVDPNATKALLAANSLPQSSSSAPSSTSSSVVSSTPIKLPTTPSSSSNPKTVIPVANPTLANAAGSSPTSLSSSGLPRATLPACSLLGVATLLLTVIHLT